MKKTLILIAAVAFVSSVASAELLKNFHYKGSVEINAYNVNNTDFNKDADDKYGDVDTRLMLDMNFNFNDDVSGVVSVVKNNRQWGTASENLDTIKNNLFVEQAHLNLKGIMGMEHKVGRQYYGNPNDLVIYFGPYGWPYITQMPVSALDAWSGVYKYNNWTFTGLLGKINQQAGNMGENISGLDIKTKIEDYKLDFNAYYYYKVDNTVAPSDKLSLIGGRFNWDCSNYVKDLTISLEYDANRGSDNNRIPYRGYAHKGNVNYKLNLGGNLGLTGEYVYISGDDAGTNKDEEYYGINPDYRPGIILGSDIANWVYIGSIGNGYKGPILSANWTPEKLSKLNIAATYYNMKVVRENPLAKKSTIGNEYDIVATWNHSEDIAIKAYYAMFKPEKDNTLHNNDDVQTALGAAFIVKF
ncbi:MAG: hypothetical protein ACP5PA_03885 [Elusimicrobiales bacterium]